MKVSVVVPTRDRPRSLQRCLSALARQDLPELEVVVVDDGSRERAALEGALAAALPAAHLIRSSGSGPATARNLGIRAAGGEIVCLTDDDCEPEAAWAPLLAEAAREAGAAGGLTVAPPQAPPAVRASQAITHHLQVDRRDDGGGLRFAPTCNMAARRDVLLKLPFDTRYPDAAGEDRDWWDRAWWVGVRGRYEPGAVVVHRQELDLRRFLRQQYRYGRGAARFRAGGGSERRLARPGFYGRLIRRGFAAGPATGGLVVAAQVATAAGVSVEAAARRADRTSRRP